MPVKQKCGPCRGFGYYGSEPKDTCKACNGMGIHILPGLSSNYKKCGPCRGFGYYGSEPKDTCKICNGIGLISVVSPGVKPTPSKSEIKSTNKSRPELRSTVFLVHGRNHSIRDKVDLFLTKELNLNVRVMEAGPHAGRTLPEKFEEIAEDCNFAVFLLTADDILSTKDGKQIRRARQNVILEIGYFWGALGRHGKIALLVEDVPDMELPTDIQGMGWIPITDDLGETKLRLRKELSAGGLL